MRNEELGLFPDKRLVSPSAERNKGPIADILKRVLPDHGTVLEISSGTGQHVVHFAREMPDLIWQPSERDEPSLQSIKQWMAAEALPNILPPLRLDVTELPWQAGPATAIICLNMICALRLHHSFGCDWESSASWLVSRPDHFGSSCPWHLRALRELR